MQISVLNLMKLKVNSEVSSPVNMPLFYFFFFLEKKPGVTDVRLLDRQPAEKHIIFTWEQVIIHFLNKYYRVKLHYIDQCVMHE